MTDICHDDRYLSRRLVKISLPLAPALPSCWSFTCDILDSLRSLSWYAPAIRSCLPEGLPASIEYHIRLFAFPILYEVEACRAGDCRSMTLWRRSMCGVCNLAAGINASIPVWTMSAQEPYHCRPSHLPPHLPSTLASHPAVLPIPGFCYVTVAPLLSPLLPLPASRSRCQPPGPAAQ